MGVNNLLMVFEESYYNNLSGGILEAFGKFFRKDMTLYLYPYKDAESGTRLDSTNLKVNSNLKELYKYFKKNQRIKDITDYNPNFSEIYSRDILRKIAANESGWEKDIPDGVAEMIKERGMFGYKEEVELKEFT